MKRSAGANGIKLAFIGLLIIIIIPIVAIKGSDTSSEYEERGEEVDCTVVSVTRIRKSQYVEVCYEDKNGDLVIAEATMNRRVSVNEEFTGLILPEKPDKVYCPADDTLKLIVVIIFGGIWILGFALFFMGIKTYRVNAVLMKKGIPTKAEVTSINQLDQFVYECCVKFNDNSGEERAGKITITRSKPFLGEDYNIVYHIKKNGKVICEVIEL